jgi:hypothetical protein
MVADGAKRLEPALFDARVVGLVACVGRSASVWPSHGGHRFDEGLHVWKKDRMSMSLTLLFLSLPASRLCHNCVRSIIYQQLLTVWPCVYRSNFRQGQNLLRARGWGLIANFWSHFFLRVTIYPAALPYNISRGHYLPEGVGYREGFLAIYFIRVTIYPHYINRGHYLPCKIYCHVLACIKAFRHMRHLTFCHDLTNI